MSRICLFVLLLLSSWDLTAQQNPSKSSNQALFNKIEYHFNLQETDSIYHLADPIFQDSLPFITFVNTLEQELYPLGRILSAEMTYYDEASNSASYRLDFQHSKLTLTLSQETERKYSTLLVSAYTETKEPEVIAPIQLPENSPIDALIDSLGMRYVRKTNTHALAISVLDQNKTANYFYGQVDPTDTRLPDENSLFEIGSITKTFTATLLAYLSESGKIQLDQSIVDFLPDSIQNRTKFQGITLQMLANHTSGLPRMPSDFLQKTAAHSENPYLYYSAADLMDFLSSYEPTQEPGTQYVYSNLGYGLLGYLLAEIDGKSFIEMYNEYIALPLHMTPQAENLSEQTDLLPVHAISGKQTVVRQFDVMAGAGALKASITDLSNYLRGHFASPENQLHEALALTRQFTFFDPPATDIGLGWHMILEGDKLVYWHNGGTGGSSSYIAFSPDLKKAIIVLSNTAESVDDIGIQLSNFLINK